MGIATAIAGLTTPAGATLAEWLAMAKEHAYREAAVTSIHGLEIIYLGVLAVVLAFGWFGLVLGEFGYFSMGALGIVALPLAPVAYLALRGARGRFTIAWSWDVAGALPALAVAAILFTPPFEYIIGGADPGVYVSTGASIARTGSIVISDSLLPTLSPEVRAGLFGSGSRLEGFYIADMDRGTVEPHGFHLYPTVLAIAHTLGVIGANLWVNPMAALLALLGFYLVARRLFGGMVALLAALFLAVNPGAIWFAHFPAAENLVQMWLFGGLLAFVLMLDTGSRRLAVLAGLVLGAMHLTKIETVALPAALVLFFIYQWTVRKWRGEYGYFLAAYSLMLLHAAMHAHLISHSYLYTQIGIVFPVLASPEYLLIVASSVLFLGVILLSGRRWIVMVLVSPVWRKIAPSVACTVVLLLAVYAYYVRPRAGGPLPDLGAVSSDELTLIVNQLSFVILGWYTSSIGLLLGVIGYGVALTRHGSSRTAVLLLVALLESLLFLSEAHIRPLHFWAARRYVTVIFPAFALFGAYALWRLQIALRGRWPEAVTPAALGFVLVVSCVGGWLPFAGHVEFRGATEQINQLAAHIPEGSVVLFDDSHAGSTLPIPLHYLWGRSSVVPGEEANENGITRRLLGELFAQGQSVYWVHSASEALPQSRGEFITQSGEMPDVTRWGYRALLEAEATIDLPMVLATVDRRPDTIEQMRYDLQIFRILPE